MKIRVKSGKIPAANAERQQALVDAAEFHAKRMNQEMEIAAQREFSNKPVGNSEFEQAIAEDVNFKIDDKIAAAAYRIAQGRHFAPGDATADWLQAETRVEGVLPNTGTDRRHGGCADRRTAATRDRRSCERSAP